MPYSCVQALLEEQMQLENELRMLQAQYSDLRSQKPSASESQANGQGWRWGCGRADAQIEPSHQEPAQGWGLLLLLSPGN